MCSITVPTMYQLKYTVTWRMALVDAVDVLSGRAFLRVPLIKIFVIKAPLIKAPLIKGL